MLSQRHTALVLFLAVAGCATHSVDRSPSPVFDMPDSALSPSFDWPETPWWLALETSPLDALIEVALAENLSLAQGIARVRASEAFLRQSQALRRPTVNLEGELQRQWERELRRPESRGGDRRRQAAASTNGGAEDGASARPTSRPDTADAVDRNTWETAYELGLQFEWELDFWGRVAGQGKADAARFEAALADQEALRLLISAQVAEAYFAAIEQRMQLALLDEQLRSAEAFQELIELRFLQGSASSVDLLQQESQVAEIRSEIPVARAQLLLIENRLDTLLGQPADGIDRTTEASLELPEDGQLVAQAFPVSALIRRPDLRAAQQRVVAADHEIAVALAERLPRITLDAALLLGGTGDLTTLSSAGGMGLFQPLLDWGQRRAAVDVARANWLEDLYYFSEAYLVAIEEVMNVLQQEEQQQIRIHTLVEREGILQSTLEQSRLRYSQGVSDYLPVLTAQQELQEIQRTILRERRELVDLAVQFYRAIGAPTSPMIGNDHATIEARETMNMDRKRL